MPTQSQSILLNIFYGGRGYKSHNMAFQSQTRQSWLQNRKLRVRELTSHVPVSSRTAESSCTIVEGYELQKSMAFAAGVSLNLVDEFCFGGPFQEIRINVPTPAQNQRIPGAIGSCDLGLGKKCHGCNFPSTICKNKKEGVRWKAYS